MIMSIGKRNVQKDKRNAFLEDKGIISKKLC